MRHDDERNPGAVDCQLELARESGRVAGTAHLASLLERRDLGEVERVPHEDGFAGQVDGSEMVDSEVAGWAEAGPAPMSGATTAATATNASARCFLTRSLALRPGRTGPRSSG